MHSRKKTNGHAGKTSYSKSVWSLRSARDVKTKALFFIPSTQAESAELAKMRPERWRLKAANMRARTRGQESHLQMSSVFTAFMASPCR